jgi:molybdate transport system substrate-binding protein
VDFTMWVISGESLIMATLGFEANKRALGFWAKALSCLLWASVAHGASVTVAAAASLKPVLEALASSFKKQTSVDEVVFVFGSSGKLHTQVKEGAPFDLYFSADMEHPQNLFQQGYAAGAARIFARGRLALWTSRRSEVFQNFDFLLRSDVSRIALANPRLAPYGARAEEFLKRLGIYEGTKPRIVYGQDVGQVAQFSHAGIVQAAFLPLSLVLTSNLVAQGAYVVVPSALHSPLEQGFVITNRGASKELAKRFAEYVTTSEAQALFRKFGFSSVVDIANSRKKLLR